MHALVWLHVVRFRAIPFGAVRFSASFANLKLPHILKHQIYRKNFILHSSKLGNVQKVSMTFNYFLIHFISSAISHSSHYRCSKCGTHQQHNTEGETALGLGGHCMQQETALGLGGHCMQQETALGLGGHCMQ
jgi:hypothetical protein